jgi:Tfp pilus assembly protein PilN
MRPLNLASRPFRNERLGEALFAVGAVGLLVMSAWHVMVIRDLLPARTSGLHREVAALDTELASLRKEVAGRRTEAPPVPVLAQWTLVKDLVDQRTLSWAGLFASLEGVVPEDVRLTSISPTVRKGQVEVEVVAIARQPSAGWEFVRALEAHAEFDDVFPTSEVDREFRYKFRYRPRAPGEAAGPPAPAAVTASASPAPEAAGEPSPDPALAAGPPVPPITIPAPGSADAPAEGPAPAAAGTPAPLRGGRRSRLAPAGGASPRGRE